MITASEFKSIFEEYRMFVFYYCKKRVINQEDAEDLTSQVFISLWRHRNHIDTPKIKPYLITIAFHKCIDFTRHKSREIPLTDVPLIEDIEDVKEIELTTEVVSQIYDIIESLPPLQKEFVKMKYIHGNEPAKIAKLLNRNPNTIKNQLVNGLLKIRKELKNRGFILD